MRPASASTGRRSRLALSIPAGWWMAVCRRRRGGSWRPGPRIACSSGVVALGERARRNELPATKVAARDAAADAGKDLVADRPTCGRDILGALSCSRLRADEHDLVSLAGSFDL